VKFSALNKDLNSLNFGPQGLKNIPYGASNMGAPSKCAISANIYLFNVKTIANKHILVAYRNKHN